MATSTDLNWEENLMAPWMSNSSRAGVILNPAFPSLKTTRVIGIGNALSELAVNSLHSSSSTSLSEDSLPSGQVLELSSPCEETLDKSKTLFPSSLANKEQMLVVKDAPVQLITLNTDLECDKWDDLDEGCSTDLLLQKLQQLKGLQQYKQEQLRRQQMGQIQRLLEEQQKLLSMVSEQQGHTGFAIAEDDVSQRYVQLARSSPVPHLPPCCSEDSTHWDSVPCVSSPVDRKDSLQTYGQILKGNLSADPFGEKQCVDGPFKLQTGMRVEDKKAILGGNSHSPEQNILGHADGNISCEEIGNAETSKSLPGGKCLETLNAEERPIPAGIQERKQTFEEFLEEQIRLEEEQLIQKGNIKGAGKSTLPKPVTKRPFLKRGEGLTRFTNAKSKASKQKESKIALPPDASEVKNTVKADKAQLHRKTAPSNKDHVSDNFVSKNAKTKKGFGLPARKTAVLRNCIGKGIPSSTRQNASERKPGELRSSVRSEISDGREKNKENIMALANMDEIDPKLSAEKYECPVELIKCLTNLSEKDPEHSFELSFEKKLENWETDKEKEKNELDEFLFLEQAADELSFASNSSLIIRILDQGQQISTGHRLSSTPVKSRQQHMNVLDITAVNNRNGEACVSREANNERVRGAITASPAPEARKDHQNKPDSKMLQAFPAAEFQDFENTRWDEDKSDGSSDMTSEEEFEVTIKPASERAKKPDLNNRGDSPEFSGYKGQAKGTSREASPGLVDQSREINKAVVSSSVCRANDNQIEFDDETSWSDFEENGSWCTQVQNTDVVIKVPLSPDCSAKSEAFCPDKVIKRKVAMMKKGDVMPKPSVSDSEITAPPTTDLMLKLFPSLRPKQKEDAQQRQDAKPNMAPEESEDTARSQLLREKLVELEMEIERFRAENASLTKLREERESALENLRKERADFEQQKSKELAQIEEFKKEETRKLQKERKVFEKYAQAARAIPDKKERDEIQTLKQQMATFQEDLKRREAKWSTTHTRLRDQIESLTSENTQLREEIKIMERFRLEAWKRKEAPAKKKMEGCGYSKRAESTQLPAVLQKSQDVTSVHQTGKSKINNKRDLSSEGRPFAKPKLAAAHNESSLDNMAMTSEDSSKTFMVNLHGNGTIGPSSALTPNSSGGEKEDERETSHPDGKVEKFYKNGSHLIIFPNGTRKEVSCDGKITTVTFFNGDVKQVLEDQRVIYYYADANTTHTTYPTGLEVLHFSNGQIEKHFPDGRKEIVFPDQTVKNVFTDGREVNVFPDGTIVHLQQDGSKIIEFCNGQQEVHTAHFKRREYPDGTIKTVYADGRQETQYASGRVRVKDKDGDIIMDTLP